MKLFKNLLNQFFLQIKLTYEDWWKIENKSLILLICCISNVIHKINLKQGASYIDSSDWIKKSIINPINDDDQCFQYAATVA